MSAFKILVLCLFAFSSAFASELNIEEIISTKYKTTDKVKHHKVIGLRKINKQSDSTFTTYQYVLGEKAYPKSPLKNISNIGPEMSHKTFMIFLKDLKATTKPILKKSSIRKYWGFNVMRRFYFDRCEKEGVEDGVDICISSLLLLPVTAPIDFITMPVQLSVKAFDHFYLKRKLNRFIKKSQSSKKRKPIKLRRKKLFKLLTQYIRTYADGRAL